MKIKPSEEVKTDGLELMRKIYPAYTDMYSRVFLPAARCGTIQNGSINEGEKGMYFILVEDNLCTMRGKADQG